MFIILVDDNFKLANPLLENEIEHPQPSMFVGKLKSYQLKVSYYYFFFQNLFSIFEWSKIEENVMWILFLFVRTLKI